MPKSTSFTLDGNAKSPKMITNCTWKCTETNNDIMNFISISFALVSFLLKVSSSPSFPSCLCFRLHLSHYIR